MMEGVEILSQSVCTEFNEIGFIACVILCGSIGFIIDLCNDFSDVVFGAIIVCVAGMFAYFLIFEFAFPEKYIQYKVTISEEVSMTEFYEKYEIIDVDGAIYTIREKNDD